MIGVSLHFDMVFHQDAFIKTEDRVSCSGSRGCDVSYSTRIRSSYQIRFLRMNMNDFAYFHGVSSSLGSILIIRCFGRCSREELIYCGDRSMLTLCRVFLIAGYN